MAKSSSTTRSGGTSRIRFIMLDAELAEGDLTQVTQAIQNALRPTVQHRVIAPPVISGQTQPSTDATLPDDEPAVDDFVETSSPQPARAERVAKPRRYPSPEVIDVDLNAERSFADFIAGKKLDSDADRYLTVAAWFKECRGLNEVTPNHVYTCFRAAHWSTSIEDFAQPLRNLKFRKFMTTPSRGSYAINHIGLAHVAALAGG